MGLAGITRGKYEKLTFFFFKETGTLGNQCVGGKDSRAWKCKLDFSGLE